MVKGKMYNTEYKNYITVINLHIKSSFLPARKIFVAIQ